MLAELLEPVMILLNAIPRVILAPLFVIWLGIDLASKVALAVGFAFTGAVVGEFVASSRGLGYLLQFAQNTYNAGLTMALILVIMAFVLVLFSLTERLERRLLRWR